MPLIFLWESAIFHCFYSESPSFFHSYIRFLLQICASKLKIDNSIYSVRILLIHIFIVNQCNRGIFIIVYRPKWENKNCLKIAFATSQAPTPPQFLVMQSLNIITFMYLPFPPSFKYLIAHEV